MITAGFGIKLFFDRDMLLTEGNLLVHYGGGTRGRTYTLDAPTNIYFYIKDSLLCDEINDSNYVTEVIELSQIPVYHGNNPKFSLYGDDIKINELIINSKVCLYYYNDEGKLRFFLHYSYKNVLKKREIHQTELYLLKYTWLTSKDYSFDAFQQLGNIAFDYISSIDVNSIITNLKIVSGECSTSRRDTQSTRLVERWLIETDDFYIIKTLINLSEKLFPRAFDDQTYCMYGPIDSKEFSLFKESSLTTKAKLNCLSRLIQVRTVDFNESQCVKYVLLWNDLFKYKPSVSGLQCCKLDTESLEKDKTEIIINVFLHNYNIGKHIAGLLYLETEAIKVPNEMMNDLMIGYKDWKLEEVLKSGLKHLTIYQSAKDICTEFNIRSNERLNFKLDFSVFPKEKYNVNDFDWISYEGS